MASITITPGSDSISIDPVQSSITLASPSNVTIEASSGAVTVSPSPSSITVTQDSTALTIATVGITTITSAVEVFATEAALLASSRTDGVIAYAQDTDLHYARQNGAWVQVSTGAGLHITTYGTEAALLADSPIDGTISYAEDTDLHYARQASAWLQVSTGAGLHITTYATEAALLADTPVDGTISYAQDTDSHFFRQNGAWVEFSISVDEILAESVTFDVDHDAANALVPSSGTKYTTQAEIDDALAAASTTAFKYLTEAFAALPTIILPGVTVTINILGVLHPSAASITAELAYDLTGKLCLGKVVLQGNAPASYETLLASTAITAHQLWNEVDATRDPRVDQAGSTFVDAHKGYFAVLDTGQTVLIHEQESAGSRLRLCEAISSAPSSVVVARPSSVLRNSNTAETDDACAQTLKVDFGVKTTGVSLEINDILIDPFGPNNLTVDDRIVAEFSNVNVAATRTVFDQLIALDDFARTPSGRGIILDNVTADFSNCSFRSETPVPASGAITNLIECGGQSTMLWRFCFLQGSEEAIKVTEQSTWRLFSLVMEAIGRGGTANSVFLDRNSSWIVDEGSTVETRGTQNILREFTAQRGVRIGSGVNVFKTEDGTFVHRMLVSGCSCSEGILAIELGTFDASTAGNGWKDGGGNTSPVATFLTASLLTLSSDWTFTSSGGQLQLGGSTFTVADVPTGGDSITDLLAAVRKIG